MIGRAKDVTKDVTKVLQNGRINCMLESMNPTEITSGDLKQIVKLLAERKMLVGRLEEVDRRLAGYDGAASQPAARLGRQAGATVARKVRAPRRGQRRKLKETILEFVHQAGRRESPSRRSPGRWASIPTGFTPGSITPANGLRS